MSAFNIKSELTPKGDQNKAIAALSKSINSNEMHNVLLGITGSGTTFSMAKVIEETQRPTLILSHNKI